MVVVAVAFAIGVASAVAAVRSCETKRYRYLIRYIGDSIDHLAQRISQLSPLHREVSTRASCSNSSCQCSPCKCTARKHRKLE